MSVNERVRLAQELHDGIAQDLVGLGYSIDTLVSATDTPHEIRAGLRSLRFATTELVQKVRSEIFVLRDGSELVAPGYEASTQYELKRIFAELLSNVVEHSGATYLTMSVADNGNGGVKSKTEHYGISGISERVRFLDGELDITSTHKGSQISITVPLPQL